MSNLSAPAHAFCATPLNRPIIAKDTNVTAATILIAIVCLLLGMAIGSLLTQRLAPQEKKRRELEAQLRRAEDEHRLYQRDVAEHFQKTATLVGNLAQSYRDVNEHLAASAMLLADTETSRQLQEAANPALPRAGGMTLSSVPPEPPKDYAPRVPGGVLSENYGFSDTAPRPSRVANDSDEKEEDDPTLKVS